MMKIDLTDSEQKLLEQIVFDFDRLRLMDRDEWMPMSEAAGQLAESLMDRKAVPEHRFNFFVSAEYNIGGRGKSRADVYRQNGNSDREIPRHPHFLPVLQYWISGPALPGWVVEEFGSSVERCGQVTSSDIVPLGKAARDLWRRSGKVYSAEAFYQLALEFMSSSRAASIYDAVRQGR